jgi:two-component system phosphate regulon response regulator PhoB/two-component system alkaline phosphatase synthesis response regulator PhoP
MDTKSLAGTKIVWVEDDKFLANMVGKRMVETGAELTQVVDGSKAFDTVKAVQPRVVVLDLLMPNVDGFEILRQIKADASTKAIPVIVLSNLGQKSEVNRATELGASKFIVKATVGLDQIVPEIVKALKSA